MTKQKYCMFCGGKVINKGIEYTGYYDSETGKPKFYPLIECENYGKGFWGYFGLNNLHETTRTGYVI